MEVEAPVIKPSVNEEITENFINVEATFQQKNPKLARKIPKFIFNYIKRITHEKEVNRILYTHRDKEGLDFVKAVLIDEFDIKIDVRGLEHLPQHERCIVAGNHPLGGIDGMILMHVIGQKRSDMLFPVNDILMNLPPLRVLFTPINKASNRKGKNNATSIQKAFASEALVPYFPAGLVSRRKGGKIVDPSWKKTFINGSKNHQRPVVPVHINGKNSTFFYRLANWRKALGIKSNIEMLYLVDEMMKQKKQSLTVTFGKAITPDTFDNTLRPIEWAQRVREHVYALEHQPEKVFE